MSKSSNLGIYLKCLFIFFIGITTMAQVQNKVLINHLGYENNSPKRFVINAPENSSFTGFEIIDQHQHALYKGELKKDGQSDKWQNCFFWSGDFSELTKTGYYRVVVISEEGDISSEQFVIKESVYADLILPELLTYFELSRCIDVYNEKDKKMTFVGDREGTVDVSGGWYDASGDVSKYLSHLSYANYLNPQQAPLAVWSFMFAADLLKKSDNPNLVPYLNNIKTEAVYGADFLVRMQDADGYFYMTVFDKWSHDPEQREICAYETQNGNKFDTYQAAYREGGGFAIAALAKVSTLKKDGEFTSKQYLETAVKGFDHLEKNNSKYCDNGKENIIDDYCALMAALELYDATKEDKYLEAARKRKESLVGRISNDENYKGWLRSDENGDRPYFHASDAGLPVISLLRYIDLETVEENKSSAIDAIKQSLAFELEITGEVSNAFGYARQYVKSIDGPKRGAFFIPHKNESGYWWQGENARLASLASAALLSKEIVDEETYTKLKVHASNQFNWVFGFNPFDMSMLEGLGRNNPKYGLWNVRGGIANGITAGFEDETDIAFLPEPYDADPAQNWRWPEQWQPHAAWMLIALGSMEATK